MGRRAEFTGEQVTEAGQDILDEGRLVTGWALRTHLGGGKPERLVAVWRAARRENAPLVGPLPEELLRQSRDGLRATVDQAASAVLERLQAAAAEAVAAADARAQVLVGEATRDASAAVETLEAALDRSQSAVSGATLARGHAEAVAEEALRAAGEARTELDGLRHHVRTLEEGNAVAQERIRSAWEHAAAAEERERAALERAVMAEARLAEVERRERAAMLRAEAAEARPTVLVGQRRGAPEPVPVTEVGLAEDGTGDSS